MVIPGSGTPVWGFPFGNQTSSDCGIATIANLEATVTGSGTARSWADIVTSVNEPAGTFDNGGPGMTRVRTDLNAALNPLGFIATRVQVNNFQEFADLVAQGNPMAIGTTMGGRGHIVAMVPQGPTFNQVVVYNNGPITPSGHGTVTTMPALDAGHIPTGSSTGMSGNIWVITHK